MRPQDFLFYSVKSPVDFVSLVPFFFFEREKALLPFRILQPTQKRKWKYQVDQAAVIVALWIHTRKCSWFFFTKVIYYASQLFFVELRETYTTHLRGKWKAEWQMAWLRMRSVIRRDLMMMRMTRKTWQKWQHDNVNVIPCTKRGFPFLMATTVRWWWSWW